MRLYDPDDLYEEVAFVAYHFNWGHDEVLGMPHWERHRWCDEISAINETLNRETDSSGRSGRTDSSGIELVNPEFEG